MAVRWVSVIGVRTSKEMSFVRMSSCTFVSGTRKSAYRTLPACGHGGGPKGPCGSLLAPTCLVTSCKPATLHTILAPSGLQTHPGLGKGVSFSNSGVNETPQLRLNHSLGKGPTQALPLPVVSSIHTFLITNSHSLKNVPIQSTVWFLSPE